MTIEEQSAALPFDLAAAKAGDGVEYKGFNGWESIDAHRLGINCIVETGLYEKMNLRMKHPRRVNVDYGS